MTFRSIFAICRSFRDPVRRNAPRNRPLDYSFGLVTGLGSDPSFATPRAAGGAVGSDPNWRRRVGRGVRPQLTRGRGVITLGVLDRESPHPTPNPDLRPSGHRHQLRHGRVVRRLAHGGRRGGHAAHLLRQHRVRRPRRRSGGHAADRPSGARGRRRGRRASRLPRPPGIRQARDEDGSRARSRTRSSRRSARLPAIARAEGVTLRHVKAHGALYNAAVRDARLADAIARAIAAFDRSLVMFGLPDSALIDAGRAAGLRGRGRGLRRSLLRARRLADAAVAARAPSSTIRTPSSRARSGWCRRRSS